MANGVDTQIDLVAQILDPNAFRVREQALVRSAQEGRHAEAQNRRANRDQQLQEILAPLQLQSQMQNLQLNTLKLQEAQRAANAEIAAQAEVGQFQDAWIDLIKGGISDQNAQATFFERIKPLTMLGQTERGMKMLEGVNTHIRDAERYQNAVELSKEATTRSGNIQDAITERAKELEDHRQKNRVIIEDLRIKGREGLRDARGRIINFDEFWNRHLNTFLVPKGSRETKEAFSARRAEAMAEMRKFYDEMKGKDDTSPSPPTSSRLQYDPQRRILIDPSTGQTYQFRP